MLNDLKNTIITKINRSSNISFDDEINHNMKHQDEREYEKIKTKERTKRRKKDSEECSLLTSDEATIHRRKRLYKTLA